MKTQELVRTAFVLGLSSFIWFGCQKDIEDEAMPESRLKSSTTTGFEVITNATPVDFCGTVATYPFLDAANVSVFNDNGNLYVKIDPINGYLVYYFAVWMGDRTMLPLGSNGYPDHPNFPYRVTFDPMVPFAMFKIPHQATEGECTDLVIKIRLFKFDDTGNPISDINWYVTTDNTYGSDYFTRHCFQKCCVIEPQSFSIFAGKHIDVGDLIVTNDDVNLFVTYKLTSGWMLKETHLYVGSLAGVPDNKKGIPVPGHFPYATNHEYGVTTFTYAIPLADLPDCYKIFAHSVVYKDMGEMTKSETAWSNGDRFSGPRWGWFSSYCTQRCN